MPTIDTIIQVNVSLAAAGASAPSFSIPLIIGGTNAGWSDYVHSYTSPAGMLTDGFTTSAPEYVYALELYDQGIQPSEFFVGHRTTPVAQVDTFQVNTVASGHVYSFSLNGVVISYTASGGDSYNSILVALNAAITSAFPSSNPVAGVVSGSGSSSILTLTSVAAGQGFSITSVDSDLTHVAATANNGIQNDLANIQGENDSWYGISLCSNADNDILQLAASVEALKKIYLAASNEAGIATSVSTDVLSNLKAKGYNRTGLIYSPGSYNLGIEAAWFGNFLPLTPGAYNPAYMSLSGIAVDTISDSARNIIVGDPVAQVAGKNGNIYTSVAGLNITQFGQMASGRFLDITIGLDWLQANIQIQILNTIFAASQAGQKIPYTDNGTAVLIQAVKSVIDIGVFNGLISSTAGISVTAPLVSTIPASQRQARLAPPISFTCTLQGAMSSATVNGVVLI